MQVVLTDAALADLTNISDYIGQHSVRNAESFVSALIDTCDDLATFPGSYPLVPRFASLGVRRRPHGDYLIFYRIRGERVEVLHVLHGARDYEALLLSAGS